ncbi:MAG: hypothetical protein Q9191_005620 [Dirinaria sp. TL-2023a]
MLFLQLFLYAAVASAACRQRQKIVLHKGAAQRQTTSSSTLSTSSTSPIAAASTPAGSSPSSSSDSYAAFEKTYSASFTQYGGCSNTAVACGTLPGGYTAAASENLFMAGPGDGAGPGCGKCWLLSSSMPGTKSIKVIINNLCPARDNQAMCAQKGLTGTNSVGMNVNFDLCMDNGSADAFFGTAASRNATGTASPC